MGAQERAEFFDAAAGTTPQLEVTTGCGRFVVSTSDGGVGRSLYVKGSRPEFRVLGRVVGLLESLAGPDAVRDRVLVDVGSNIGTTVVCALVTHGFGSAIACEPGPEAYGLLRTNLALNAISDRVQALNLAVSSQTGRSQFVVTERRTGASWLALEPGAIEAAQAVRARRIAEDPQALDHPRPRRPVEVSEMTVVEVELTTLDQLVTDGVLDPGRTGLVWIDVEGHEGHVLAGASTLLERGVPAVFEFNPDGLHHGGGVDRIAALAEAHYTHFVDVRRRVRDGEGPRLSPRPIAELRDHADRFTDPTSAVAFTDLLLLRLE